ncbi:hypothetical protein ACLDYA_11600 [Acinetobacter baumannii]|uniref:hypothetical protein n=2 Tax=Acinetobacter baumannii TaxID=470 RepID=UPI000DE70CD8|nr:hypothetical protein [Acinetobacter baumannii]MCW8691129.1 hypothetical protein [Acinetobacter baumannii]MCW8767944.1 hypothetical protein [Acinetobacter baumannii]MDI9701869.1 hypothetical protein [Acinetobacter baumannii]MDI9740101.1 hypothetical protein [Acinetobacter baumannii]MDI9805078.1 hypothetical protein [Acinetobacter baumannii]
MIKQQVLLNKFLEILIVSPIETENLKKLKILFHEVLKVNKCLDDSHPIPYHAITRYMYNYEKEIIIEDLNLLMDALETQLVEEVDIKVLECFRKFKNHISLASTQKYYIQKIAADALETAKKAEEEAEKARDTYKDIMVNYITILGIFASIIITIFGGMQIISATTGLLQANLNLATLVLVLSFLTLLIVLILAILLNWISNLKEETRNNKFVYIALSFTVFCIAISGWYIHEQKNSDLPHTNTKVLIKDESKDK